MSLSITAVMESSSCRKPVYVRIEFVFPQQLHLLYFIQEPWIVNCQLLSSLNLLIILTDKGDDFEIQAI